MKKVKDGLDIIDDYNKLTSKQVEAGYIGEVRQTKKRFTKKEKEQLDNIPEFPLTAQERLKEYQKRMNNVSRQQLNNTSDEFYELPQSTQQNKISISNQLVKHDNNSLIEQTDRSIIKTKDFTKPKQSHEQTIVPQNQVVSPPIDESGDIDLNKLFSSEVGSESDVVKELFSMENIKVKTELTKDEISIISRLELQASMTQNFYLTKVLKELETLRVSKDRKSRGEFVNSFRGIGDNQSGVSAFSKLGNIFKNDKV